MKVRRIGIPKHFKLTAKQVRDILEKSNLDFEYIKLVEYETKMVRMNTETFEILRIESEKLRLPLTRLTAHIIHEYIKENRDAYI